MSGPRRSTARRSRWTRSGETARPGGGSTPPVSKPAKRGSRPAPGTAPRRLGHRLEDALVALRRLLDREGAPGDRLESCPAQPRAQRRVARKLGQTGGEAVDVADRHGEAILAVPNDLGDATLDRRHDRHHAARHRFEQCQRQAFIVGGQNENVGGGVLPQDGVGGQPAGELRLWYTSEPGTQGGIFGSIADQGPTRLYAQPGQASGDPRQVAHALLLGHEPASIDDVQRSRARPHRQARGNRHAIMDRAAARRRLGKHGDHARAEMGRDRDGGVPIGPEPQEMLVVQRVVAMDDAHHRNRVAEPWDDAGMVEIVAGQVDARRACLQVAQERLPARAVVAASRRDREHRAGHVGRELRIRRVRARHQHQLDLVTARDQAAHQIMVEAIDAADIPVRRREDDAHPPLRCGRALR